MPNHNTLVQRLNSARHRNEARMAEIEAILVEAGAVDAES